MKTFYFVKLPANVLPETIKMNLHIAKIKNKGLVPFGINLKIYLATIPKDYGNEFR